MTKPFKSPFNKLDWILLFASLILVLIGLSTLQSSVIALSTDDPTLNPGLLRIQIFSLSIGIFLFVCLILINYRYLVYLSPFIYLLILGLLVSVLKFGTEIRGVTRWFDFGVINFQPATLSSFLFILAFSTYLASVGKKINQFVYLIGALMLVLPVVFLILLQPNLGMAGIIAMISFGLLHLSALKFSRLIVIYLIILISLPILWANLAGYQKERALAFINPGQDPLGTGYNALQSIIAVGSGNLFGRGWGHGTQSHLQFLPEQHTDFIFAAFVEEQGFLGAIMILLLYGLIIWRSFLIMQKSTSFFGQLLAGGAIIWLGAHVLINIGMNLGIAPITGVPLPLMSYGGTAIITTFLILGLIQSVHVHQ